MPGGARRFELLAEHNTNIVSPEAIAWLRRRFGLSAARAALIAALAGLGERS